jgi:hypothetical protein
MRIPCCLGKRDGRTAEIWKHTCRRYSFDRQQPKQAPGFAIWQRKMFEHWRLKIIAYWFTYDFV